MATVRPNRTVGSLTPPRDKGTEPRTNFCLEVLPQVGRKRVMSRYNLRPNLREDTLQEFQLVRLQGVEWRRLKNDIEHLSKMLGSAFPSMTYTRGDLAFRVLLLSLMTIKRSPGVGSGASWRRWALSSKGRCACRLKGERTGLVPITTRTRTGSNEFARLA